MSKNCYFHPDWNHLLTEEDIKNLDVDSQIEIMKEWFARNYADPAENTPYETAEGGYIYIWGGPYYAREELMEEFGLLIDEQLINDLSNVLEEECYEWSGKPTVDDLDEYFFDSIYSNSRFYDTFVQNINNIKELLEVKINPDLQQNYLRLLYINTITALETYLSDAFINTILSNDKLFRKFIEKNPDFKERKLNVSEIFKRVENIKNEVKKYLLDLMWHNLKKIKPMYKETLDVDFPADMSAIFKAIILRHDFVHRNGRGKDGGETLINPEKVKDLIDKVSFFVESIDKQLSKTVT